MNKSEDDFFFSQEPPSALNDETNQTLRSNKGSAAHLPLLTTSVSNLHIDMVPGIWRMVEVAHEHLTTATFKLKGLAFDGVFVCFSFQLNL